MSRVRVRGVELAYDEAGEGAGVVLLHGFPFDRSLWREQAAALAENYRVITPDLRGFGASSGDGAEAATMDEMARDVAALLDELVLERVALGGLSMGGYVALAFYRLFPRRVRALVLADTRPQGDTDEARTNRETLAQRALAEGMQPVVEAMLPKMLAPATFTEQPEVVARLRAMMLATPPAGAAAALRGMALRRDQRDLLPDILAPTLILVGSEDTITPPADAELMRREIHGARLERIEGAGHCSNLERPAEFNRALAQFLADPEP
ncbi:MAG TPA: alpha/beta fold hydrolase [Pyrinomonadaceae bacterium]|jgi:pimeloyl-ACP methyl ester carboxylesterase